MILRNIQLRFQKNAGECQRCGGRVLDEQETEARQLHPDLRKSATSRFETNLKIFQKGMANFIKE